jgi:glutathione S-transferase
MPVMSELTTIIGGPISPYVRKVMAVCDLKGVAYRIDPIIPFQGNDEFSRLSPLRRIPVLIDDQVTLADSTVIAEYLDERYGRPRLLPDTPAARALARWIEEFADTRIGDVFIWRLFNTAVIAPHVWKLARDDDAIARVVREDLPAVMDHLETIAPSDGFVCGSLAIADIAVAVHVANLRWASTGADLSAWPKTVAWVGRTEAVPALTRLNHLAERSMTARRTERPALYAEFGIPLTETSLAGKEFRKGPLSV